MNTTPTTRVEVELEIRKLEEMLESVERHWWSSNDRLFAHSLYFKIEKLREGLSDLP